MTERERPSGDEISLFALGTALLRSRWRIARWTLAGGIITALLVAGRPRLYSAHASFVPQGNDGQRAGLTNLAGQFGINIPIPVSGTQAVSPEFYLNLLTSPLLLRPIVRDTFVVEEMGGQRLAFLDLFRIEDGTPKYREEQGVKRLSDIVKPGIQKSTGIVEVSAATKWPSVSLAIVNRLLAGVNDYNQRARQGQAAAERKFLEGRLTQAGDDLRVAEDRLVAFLRTNRQITNSPQLTFEQERLQREVTLRQQVVSALTQAYEDARLREVRDTPVITVFEQPTVPSLPLPRGRVARVLLGLVVGAFVGILLTLLGELLARRRQDGLAEAHQLERELIAVKGEVLGPVRWIGERIRR
jgi:uncharacterized protein involved in exopolysaccharide biosynthesis